MQTVSAKQAVVDVFAGKDPVLVFEMFMNEDIRSHLIKESVRYARQKNNQDFSIDHNDIRKLTGILLLTGYHTLPQQQLYW